MPKNSVSGFASFAAELPVMANTSKITKSCQLDWIFHRCLSFFNFFRLKGFDYIFAQKTQNNCKADNLLRSRNQCLDRNQFAGRINFWNNGWVGGPGHCIR